MGFLGFDSGSSADLYIDLGTVNTLVVTRASGLVANEPSVIAYREANDAKRKIVAIGSDASLKMGRTPQHLVTSLPLREGVVADLHATEAMLRYFISKASHRFSFQRPRAIISLPFDTNDVEKNALRDAALAAGARQVTLIEEPMAAALGTGLDVEAPQGNMVIDIGGGTTEIAVISLCGVVHCETVRIGGLALDQAIVEYLRREHNLVTGTQSAEKLKMRIASALPGDKSTRAPIRGVDFVSGLPREVLVSADQVHDAISDLLEEIFEAGRRTLERIPPDLVPDIMRDGATVAGGGALIHALDERLSRELRIPVRIDADPLRAIARGGERALRNPVLLERIAI